MGIRVWGSGFDYDREGAEDLGLGFRAEHRVLTRASRVPGKVEGVVLSIFQLTDCNTGFYEDLL